MVEQMMVIGAYADSEAANRAVTALYRAGFRSNQVAADARSKGTESIFSHLTSMGVPENDAGFFEREFQAGHVIVMVMSENRYDEATDILRGTGAISPSSPNAANSGNQSMLLREEQLQAQRQPLVTSELRIRKRIITEEKTITVQVSREVVEIEQVALTDGTPPPASSDVTERIVNVAPGDTIRIPVREEQVFVEKRPMLVEEIIVSKRVVQENRQVSDVVRKEVPRLEREGSVPMRGNLVED